MLQELTVKDIAAAIAHGGDHRKVDRVLRRVKHWSKEGLLSNWSSSTTGTGDYRRYQPEVVYWVALISELTQYGMTAHVAKTGLDRLQGVLSAHTKDRGGYIWWSAVMGTEEVTAVFCVDFYQQIATVHVDVGPETTPIPGSHASSLRINLTRLFARIPR